MKLVRWSLPQRRPYIPGIRHLRKMPLANIIKNHHNAHALIARSLTHRSCPRRTSSRNFHSGQALHNVQPAQQPSTSTAQVRHSQACWTSSSSSSSLSSPAQKLDPLRIVLFGAPGAGKGTQSSFIQRDFNIRTISTGDALRQLAATPTPIGKQIQEVLDRGELVSDALMIGLLSPYLQEKRWLLDGFPRTLSQAESLITHLNQQDAKTDFIFNIQVSEEILWDRVKDRWIHPGSGRIYNTQFKPPKNPGLDDITQEPLVQRSDDTLESIRHRLEIFQKNTTPILQFLKKFATVVDVESPSSLQGYSIIKPILQNHLGLPLDP